jgi:signal transduction histidine kinase
VNATNLCRTDDVGLASTVRTKEHVAADVVAAEPTQPALLWSGLGIAYIDAMLGGLIQQGRPLPALLNALCNLFDTTVEGYCSSVLLLDRTRTRIRHAVGPGLPSNYNELLEGRSVNYVEGDTQWASRRGPAIALAQGLKSCWSSPVLSLTGEMLGIFLVYEREAGGATPLHPALIHQFTHVAGIAIERTRSEHTLRQTEALLAKALHLSSTGSFSWRVTAGEITWSEEVYRIFELDPAVPPTLELVRNRVHRDDLPMWYEMIDRVRNDGSDYEHEYRLTMPDHSVKYLHVVAHASRDQDGQLEYVGVVQDVSQRKLAEDALIKTRTELAHLARVQSLGALTASIAHEVNQPLCAIGNNANSCLRYLAMDPPNVERAREAVQRTIRDGNRAADVITGLRALFRKKDTTIESVDLNEAAREVITLSLGELHRSQVIVRSELADELPAVLGDRVQFQQVILNLLLNAKDAMNEVDDRPRQLLISTVKDAGERVRLSVRDVGVGFASAQDRERLFEPFYTTKSNGMGIGLAISRTIIESHRGRLWATGNEGPGATFAFSIPCAVPGASSAPTTVTAFRRLL